MADITTKDYECETKVNSSDRTVIAKISTIDVDRDGDVMMPSGIETSSFKKNPVVLFAHGMDPRIGMTPIGRVGPIEQKSRAIEASVKFADRPPELPDAQEWIPDTMFALFKQKVLNGFSVGFRILDARRPNNKDIQRFGEQVTQVITRWAIHELSVAPVPANQNALATAVSKGILGPTSLVKAALDIQKPERVELQTETEKLVMPPVLSLDIA